MRYLNDLHMDPPFDLPGWLKVVMTNHVVGKSSTKATDMFIIPIVRNVPLPVGQMTTFQPLLTTHWILAFAFRRVNCQVVPGQL